MLFGKKKVVFKYRWLYILAGLSVPALTEVYIAVIVLKKSILQDLLKKFKALEIAWISMFLFNKS